MLKGQEIFQEIIKDMEDIFKQVPEFGNSYIKIIESVKDVHLLSLDYKNPNKNESINNHLDNITNILIDSIKKDYVTKEQVTKLYDSIQSMIDADTAYVINHLDKLSENFSNIQKAAQDLSKTLDRACGRTPEEEIQKSSIIKSLSKILNFRKNNTDVQENTTSKKNKF